MNTVKSIAVYAVNKRISLYEAFEAAWRFHFKRNPATDRLEYDLETYRKYGGVPLYVTTFLRHVNESKSLFRPKYIPWYAQMA